MHSDPAIAVRADSGIHLHDDEISRNGRRDSADLRWPNRPENQIAKDLSGRFNILTVRVYIGRKPGTTKAKPKRAKQLRDKGLTHAKIAEALGVSKRTVIRYLKK